MTGVQTCALPIYLARLDVGQLRRYRAVEVQGNAYRHPGKYHLLVDTGIEEPFIRETYRP